MKKILGRAGAFAGVAGVVLASALSATPASAQSTEQALRRPYCDPGTSYTLSKDGWNWYAFDSGTVKNSSTKATLHKSISHSTTRSKTTTKSAEVGLEVSYWVAKINAKFGYSVSKTVSYTTTTSFTVDVPPRTTVKYKDGIIVRHFTVKVVHLYDNCTTKTSYGKINAADNYSHVWDA